MRIILIKNELSLSEKEYSYYPKGQYVGDMKDVICEWDISEEWKAADCLSEYRCEYDRCEDGWGVKEYLLVYLDCENVRKIVPADEVMYFIKNENTCERNFLSSEIDKAIGYYSESELRGEDAESELAYIYRENVLNSRQFEDLIDVLNNYKDALGDGSKWSLDRL